MARAAFLLVLLAAWSGAAAARETVDASAPAKVSVTLYRDPARGPGEDMNRNWPRGFAMISETRTVTLPPGESTIRFEGVAEGMVAVSAIVTGLPGGTIEKNRNADLLSPAALVDGTLGNRVTLTRTNPATGEQVSQSAIVRTRADGGLVLQTQEGFEAVRCSGLPEKLTFDRVPAGLSAQPVFTIDTRDAAGGTYRITLTYLAWGFDWQAHYVATLAEGGKGAAQKLALRSWLTLLNDNGQSFADAELLAVAGALNIESDYRALSDPPRARPLQLTCYPLGSTAAGTPFAPPPPPPPPAPMMMEGNAIVVTSQRLAAKAEMAPAMMASEENLGDLKLYRVPEPVTVAAKSLKQIAFLDRDEVSGSLFYRADCSPWAEAVEPAPATLAFRTVNDRKHGLGVALPMGGITLFAPSAAGDLLVGEETLRDYASGQDVEVDLAPSDTVLARCEKVSAADPDDEGRPWVTMRASVSNANGKPVTLRLALGRSDQWTLRGKVKGVSLKDGQWMLERSIPPGKVTEIRWDVRMAESGEDG